MDRKTNSPSGSSLKRLSGMDMQMNDTNWDIMLPMGTGSPVQMDDRAPRWTTELPQATGPPVMSRAESRK